jgi:hypothetical protein
MDQPRKAAGQPQQPAGKPQQAAAKPQPVPGKPQPAPGKPQPAAAAPQQMPGKPAQGTAKPRLPTRPPGEFITVPVETEQDADEVRSPWMRPPVLIGLGLLGLVLLILAGRLLFGGSKGANLTKVRGTVIFEGAPLAGALVTFVPAAKGSSAVATTDDKGRFDMKTPGLGNGAAPGDYRVTITKLESDQQAMTPEEAKTYLSREGKSPPRGTAKNLLPAKYGSNATSPITVTVEARAGKPLKFELNQAGN